MISKLLELKLLELQRTRWWSEVSKCLGPIRHRSRVGLLGQFTDHIRISISVFKTNQPNSKIRPMSSREAELDQRYLSSIKMDAPKEFSIERGSGIDHSVNVIGAGTLASRFKPCRPFGLR